MANLHEDVAGIIRDLELKKAQPEGPALDLSNLPADVPACVDSILRNPPKKSEHVDFNKLALHLATYLKARGYKLAGALGIVDDFLQTYTWSETYPTAEARRKHFEELFGYVSKNGDYKFDCSFMLGLHLPGSAFDCKKCAIKRQTEPTTNTTQNQQESAGDAAGVQEGKAAEPSKFPPRCELEITEDEWCGARTTPTCIVENYLYADVGVLTAPGGSGKTTLQLYEIVHIVLGRKLYNLEVKNCGWCLILTAEDPREICIARLREISIAMGLSPEEIAKIRRDIVIVDVSDFDMKLIRMEDGNIIISPDVDAIIARYKDDPPVMVVFDPSASFGVGESKINENEQGLIDASRKIRNAFKCCVRIVCHTGKANSREKTLDQYTSRGGSALPDGSRMVAVMQGWSPVMKEKLPQGCKADSGSSVTILARPKITYAPPNQPLIFIQRTGWSFEHFTQVFISDEDTQKAVKEQVLRFLSSQEVKGILHQRKSLESNATQMSLSRNEIRDTVAQLVAEGRVIEKPLPKERCKGAKKTYLAVA